MGDSGNINGGHIREIEDSLQTAEQRLNEIRKDASNVYTDEEVESLRSDLLRIEAELQNAQNHLLVLDEDSSGSRSTWWDRESVGKEPVEDLETAIKRARRNIQRRNNE